MILKRLLIPFVILVLLAVGFLVDQAARGPFWQFAWSVSGEESALGQVRGVVEWSGNLIRPQPQTRPMVPIDNTNINPYGINTFLEQEPDPAKVEAKVAMIADAGFAWIRQQFVWEDIEIDGKGNFTDRRNVEAIGVISAWDKYDRIVDLAEENGLRIQARLDNPPSWSRAEPDEITGAFAPPDDFQDFVDFAVVVAERYQGRIHHYQVWNEPNIFPEWGNNPVSPEDYTRLLCMTYDALKAVDPDIVVITGALAPTQSLTGRDLNDFIFLQRMYQAGVSDCFDVLSMQGYGLNSGPTDRRMRATVVNIARNQYIRDLMVANGDANKAIWISEAAWNFVPSADEAPDIAEPRTMFGQVTPDKAAEYIPILYQRAQKEWPWVGVVNYWFFSRRDDSERNQPFYYFRMVEPDFKPEADPPFTPLPVYGAMRDHITETLAAPVLYAGVHQADGHWAIAGDDMTPVDDSAAQFGRAAEVTQISFTAQGTDVSVRWRGDAITLQAGDRVVSHERIGDGWQTARISLSARAGDHDIRVSSASDAAIMIDSITVMDRTWHNTFPVAAVVVIGVLMTVYALYTGFSLRRQNSGEVKS